MVSGFVSVHEFCRVKRELIITKDGSSSVSIPQMQVTYHSLHGAIQESRHVFIRSGLLDSCLPDYTGMRHVLEIGLGTGLNVLLTLLEADRAANRIYYTAIEADPLEEAFIKELNYCSLLGKPDYQARFEKIHTAGWEEMVEISMYMQLTKHRCRFHDYETTETFNLVYYDPFAPAAQPELWTEPVFKKLFDLLLPGGILVTYCSKGEVRRAMASAGFSVEKIPGPPGKREMVRARKKE